MKDCKDNSHYHKSDAKERNKISKEVTLSLVELLLSLRRKLDGG